MRQPGRAGGFLSELRDTVCLKIARQGLKPFALRWYPLVLYPPVAAGAEALPLPLVFDGPRRRGSAMRSRRACALGVHALNLGAFSACPCKSLNATPYYCHNNVKNYTV